jgi:hypothetical protein
MARKNRVQFQKGLSWRAFQASYGTEDLCRAALSKLRWPDGFRCPRCGEARHTELKKRRLLQCRACRLQSSLTADTIFHCTKLSLVVWFQGIYLVTQSKNGISSLELARQLGVSQNTAWKVKHKLMQVMLEREAGKRLTGAIQIDDAFLGGERHGGKRGRGAPGKVPLIAAVQTVQGRPIKAKLTRVAAHRSEVVAHWAQSHLEQGSCLRTDGLGCFRALGEHGFDHQSLVTGSGYQAARHPEFVWINTLLGNVKSALRGTYRSHHPKHAPRYLAEFQYRFNRRFDLPSLIPRLAYVATRTPPMPMRLLKLAEAHW